MKTLKSSVAMATYNGEKYIYQQLDSIFNQTRRPDEVIICDDCSTDNTVNIIKSFIDEHKLNSCWHLYQNESNKGYIKNFLDCALMTSGDVIFYSDQDDLWDEKKIIMMMERFEENANVRGLLCSFSCIDSDEKESNTLLNNLRKGKKSKFYKVPFYLQVKNVYCGGLTLAIKSKEIAWLSKIILDNNLSHDVPIGLFLAAENGFYRLCETLVYRRVHEKNVSAPKYTIKSRISNIPYHIKGRKVYLNLLTTCYNYYKNRNVLSNRDFIYLKKTIDDTKNSIYYLQNRKYMRLFCNIFTINPMNNKYLKIVNFICGVFGNYDKV
ncbi:glycosyltransferase family 2 protein [Clostridium carnis]